MTVQENDSVASAAYLIITGERRWWAHVLLHVERRPVKDRPASEIEAKVAPAEAVRALQLIENMARDDLTAWERATGIEALREELGETEVTWTQVEKIIGISHQYRSRIMRVLRLGDEAQGLVRDYGLAEKTIRPVTNKLLKRPDLQVAALRQLAGSRPARKDDIKDKLIQYQKEAAKVLWEAFQEGRLTADPTFDELLQTDSEAVQAYKMLQALVKLARNQILLESQLETHTSQLADHEKRLEQVEITLGDPGRHVSPDQASQFSQGVKAVAHAMGGHDKHYQAVYGEMYRKFGITSYKLLPAAKFQEAMTWLTGWYGEGTGSKNIPF